MDSNLLILLSSIAVQAVNVVLAVRLVRRTKNYLAGGLIISAVFLMAFRCAISLHRSLSHEGVGIDLAAESVALVSSFLLFAGTLSVTSIIESEIRSKREKEETIRRLQKALGEIKTLKGIVPICASCKNIRDDRGYWNKLEKFFSEHLTAEFSHGICPACAEKLYPDLPLGLQEPRDNEQKSDD